MALVCFMLEHKLLATHWHAHTWMYIYIYIYHLNSAYLPNVSASLIASIAKYIFLDWCIAKFTRRLSITYHWCSFTLASNRNNILILLRLEFPRRNTSTYTYACETDYKKCTSINFVLDVVTQEKVVNKDGNIHEIVAFSHLLM